MNTATKGHDPKNHVCIVEEALWKSPVPDGYIRFVCISDTHSQVERRADHFLHKIPPGDVLLHAGDFTLDGGVDEMVLFNNFMGKLPHPIKIAIPGNHDSNLDPRGLHFNVPMLRQFLGLPPCKDPVCVDNYREVVVKLLSLLTNVVLLIDAFVTVCGIKIYGLPWLPAHGAPGFGLRDKEHLEGMYRFVPSDTDIILSHGPVHGVGDMTGKGRHVGCVTLKKIVTERIKPKVFVCGHIHEGHGVFTEGLTTFINASICNGRYRPTQNPVVFDYPLPASYSRQDVLQLRASNLTVKKATLNLSHQLASVML